MKIQLFFISIIAFYSINPTFAISNKCQSTIEVLHENTPKSFTSSNNLTKSSSSLFHAQGKKIYITGRIFDANCVPVEGALISIWQTNTFGNYQFIKAVTPSEKKKDSSSKAENKEDSSSKVENKEDSNSKAETKEGSKAKVGKTTKEPSDKLIVNEEDKSSEQKIQKKEKFISMEDTSINAYKKGEKHDPYFMGTGSAISDNMGYYQFITIFPGKEDGLIAPVVNFSIAHNNFSPLETSMYFSDEEHTEETLVAKKIKNNTYNFDIVLQGKNHYLKY